MITKQRGASLIEVLIAFVLVGLSALGLMKLQIAVESHSDVAESSIKALYQAEAKMEKFTQRGMNSYHFDEIAADSCNSATICDSVAAVGVFKTQCTVTPQGGALDNKASLVEVKVCWIERFDDPDEPQSVTLKTMISTFSEFEN